MKKNLLLIVCTFLLFLACKNKKIRKPVVQDASITLKTSYNNLFLDSALLENFVSTHNDFKNFRTQFFDFYKQRNYQFAWFDTSGLVEQANNFYNLQNGYISDIQDSSLYNPTLAEKYEAIFSLPYLGKVKDTIALSTELLLTGQFFKYANKVYHGSDIDAKELGWFIPRKKIDITAALDSIVKNGSKTLDEYEPLNSQYRLLEKCLKQYYSIKKESIWDSISKAKSFKKGDSGLAIITIKNKLFAFGDLAVNDKSIQFDSTLFIGIKQFQKRVGLPAIGNIGAATIKELNKPIDTLIRKILVNMERSRWMLPDTSTIDRLVVNIPEYKLYVYDSGKLSFTMPVVVGTAANSTVIFNGNIKYIVFSPYWNVTDDITKKEIIPAMKKNPNYLEKNNMEIVKYNGKIPVVRQKPGPNNSLGGVKFLFPNSYNIYLHDTPFKDGFSATKRSFSHGCIRLGDPIKLAQFLLRRDTLYTIDSIKTLTKQPKEKWLNANPTVPVTIKYFTAWVDNKGLLNFREDIYNHDNKMATKLFTK